MSIKIFDTPEVQGFLKTVSGLDGNEGDPRAKQIIHRIVSDLFKAIDDLDITPDEYWTAVVWLNELGTAGQAGLISPRLGFDQFLYLRPPRTSRPAVGIPKPPPPSKARYAPSTPRYDKVRSVPFVPRSF